MLEPYASSSILDQVFLPPPSSQLINGLEFEVINILESKVVSLTNYIGWLCRLMHLRQMHVFLLMGFYLDRRVQIIVYPVDVIEMIPRWNVAGRTHDLLVLVGNLSN